MTPLAIANLINSFKACSGFLTSTNDPQVLTTPATKKRTSKAKPIACIALLILTITDHIAPPLNSWGVVVRSDHISDNFSFQVFKALIRF